MVDGATRRRTQRPRLLWAVGLVAATALVGVLALLQGAGTMVTSEPGDARPQLGHPNTRSLILPLLPRP